MPGRKSWMRTARQHYPTAIAAKRHVDGPMTRDGPHRRVGDGSHPAAMGTKET
jgi:hypothetical protein